MQSGFTFPKAIFDYMGWNVKCLLGIVISNPRVFLATRTRIRRNQHPQPWVGVFMGTGTGFHETRGSHAEVHLIKLILFKLIYYLQLI